MVLLTLGWFQQDRIQSPDLDTRDYVNVPNLNVPNGQVNGNKCDGVWLFVGCASLE